MTQTPWLGFSINRLLKTPVFEQICAALRTSTISGDLAQGTRLPPTRVFATELGVSRSTVVTAYEQLVAEGYLQSVQGSGYTVCAVGEVELASQPDTSPVPKSEDRPNPARPFASGLPDMRLFPHHQWAKTVARVCRTNPQAMLTGGTVFGNFELRKAIAKHVSEWRGIMATPEQIIITAGSMDALEICLRCLATSTDSVALEDPGYLPLRQFVQAQGVPQVYLGMDEHGAVPPPSGTTPRLAVLTPSHQYPLGGAMSPHRRLDFIHWAKAQDAWIIEDDYDSEFRYAGRPIPAMAGFDHLNRTLYVGSFSKIFSNALRLGYVIVPDELRSKFRATIQQFGPKASYMPQQALAEFIQSGEFYRHLRRVRRIYGERRKYLLDRLSQDFTAYGDFVDHQAGMQVLFRLNAGLKDTQIVQIAKSNGLAMQPLSMFSTKDDGQNGLILGFCAYSIEELGTAIDTLGLVLADLTSRSG